MHILDSELLANMLKAKRGTIGLRETAKQIGNVSAPTLSRVEQGKIPDVDTFIQICKWLGVSTDTFIIENKELVEVSTQDKLLAHLRAERELDPSKVAMLIEVINLAYQQQK
jgi:transcriptional regulator with XRE-family HTH domain